MIFLMLSKRGVVMTPTQFERRRQEANPIQDCVQWGMFIPVGGARHDYL